MDISRELEDRINKLADKYQASGQELLAYLDGLLHADYITYWDYIHLDTLLSLQTPRTNFPDEEIFIMYHQITELYFKLALHEINQIAQNEDVTVDFLKTKMERINRYFGALTHSFGVMEKGMDREQFLQFRMSLIPASGFQSVQYRFIEVCATDMLNLVNQDFRKEMAEKKASIGEMYRKIYWKWGATMEKGGEKTLTLRQFEKKYSQEIILKAEEFQNKNLWQQFMKLGDKAFGDEDLRRQFRTFDVNVNINWPLQHYKTAVVYLAQRPNDIASTGGTNWQKYLPPRFQKRIFYPELWSDTELQQWGKKWVVDVLADAGVNPAAKN